MKTLSINKINEKTRLSVVSSAFQKNNITKIRLHLHIPKFYQHQPVISQLISKHNVVVNITGASLGKNTGGEGYFDVELRGTISQISLALAYLESLNIKIIGKPNADGDSWYC